MDSGSWRAELTAALSARVSPAPLQIDASKVDLTWLKPSTMYAAPITALERDAEILNDRLQKAIYQLELRLPGQARFVNLQTAQFASEVLDLLRGK